MTIKQLSDEMGVDKQKVYRYIKKNHINEAHQENGVMYYDENVQRQVKSHFTRIELESITSEKALASASFDVLLKQSEMLKNELEAKNEQIAQLQKQLEQTHKLIDQEQQLRMAEHQRVLMLEQQEEEPQKKHWWKFGKQ